MANDLALLGALFATQNMTLEDVTSVAEFLEHVDVQYKEPPETLEAAIDLALNFFREDPDTEAQRVAEAAQVEHDASTCPGRGGGMMDEIDVEQAIDLWVAVRCMMDKAFIEREEC